MMTSSATPTTFSAFDVAQRPAGEWTHHTRRLVFMGAALASWAVVLVPVFGLLRLF